MSTISHVAEQLSQTCFLPLTYFVQQKRYRPIQADEKYQFFIPENKEDRPIFVKKRVYKKADYNKSTTLKMASLLLPGTLAGGILKGISALSSKLESTASPQKVEGLYIQKKQKNADPNNAVYFEVTRRIKNLDDLEARMEQLPDKEKWIPALLEAIKKEPIPDWEAPIFKLTDYPLYLLAALKNRKVDAQQFGTVMLYWVTCQRHPAHEIKSIPIFINGQRNKEAERYIIQTLRTRDFTPQLPPREDDLLNAEQIDTLFAKLQTLPASEQQIFIILDVQGIIKKGESPINKTISQHILYGQRLNVFNRLLEEETALRMIPSVGLMQAFIDVIGGENAVKINPVIGLSSLDDIRKNGLEATRDMAFQFPGILLPERADGVLAPDADFTYHDFYHTFMASMLSDTSRKRIIALADAIKAYLQANDLPENEGGLWYYSTLIDMEHKEFRPDWSKYFNIENRNEDFLLWEVINRLLSTGIKSVKAVKFDNEHQNKILEVVAKKAQQLGLSLDELDKCLEYQKSYSRDPSKLTPLDRIKEVLKSDLIPVRDVKR